MRTKMKASLALLTLPLAAEVKLPAIISDHMLIQQQMPVRIWGKAAAGEKVAVEIHGQHASAVADSSGAWEAFLPPMTAGGPYEMNVNQLVIHDVLIGEVWVGSGQSNMELPMTRVKDSEAEIAAANFPQIRLFWTWPGDAETCRNRDRCRSSATSPLHRGQR